jgi:geranylgeranyl diphosphate synthase type II
VRILAEATGSDGLVGGETLDLESERLDVDPWAVRAIHERKTGALIGASCGIGAVLGGAEETEASLLVETGRRLGVAFQIVDDLLNETSSVAALGKPAGSDRKRGKQTFPAAFGVEEARAEADRLLASALEEIRRLPGDTSPLEEVARACVARSF